MPTDLQRDAKDAESRLRIIGEKLRKTNSSGLAFSRLSGPQRSVLQVLIRSTSPLSHKELCHALGLSQSAVSWTADRLIHCGMVVRRPDPIDARIVRLEASAEVRQLHNVILPAFRITQLSTALSKTTDRRRRVILDGLEELQKLLEDDYDPVATTKNSLKQGKGQTLL